MADDPYDLIVRKYTALCHILGISSNKKDLDWEVSRVIGAREKIPVEKYGIMQRIYIGDGKISLLFRYNTDGTITFDVVSTDVLDGMRKKRGH